LLEVNLALGYDVLYSAVCLQSRRMHLTCKFDSIQKWSRWLQSRQKRSTTGCVLCSHWTAGG